ncbi:hypothetical protein SAY86_003699 [Trapa natans]|uniref:RING-type domain-containing protein n=1 Tax=Trapa natans TaxID=22666 RepID=A0AAN7RH92_TRANT|nr:hypothetical protein SAY86_003699 [Trapa natans]
MGSACCIAAKDQRVPNLSPAETLQRSTQYSPSWSFPWDNRRRVAGETDNISSEFSHGISDNRNMHVKKPFRSTSCDISARTNQVENFGPQISQSVSTHGVDANNMIPTSDISTESNNPVQVKNTADPLGNVESLTPKISFSITIPSLLSTPTEDNLSPQNHAVAPSSTPSRRARHSSGRQLLRQISDSRILKMKSPPSISMSEGRSSSFALSTGSHDFTLGSQGSSPDCWSLHNFPELVTTSQRRRWSFESEQSRGWLKCSPSSGSQACGVCKLFLKEKINQGDSYSIVSVLVCGHFFHAECLEQWTKEADKYDPTCPICKFGEKQVLKMSQKTSREEAKRLKKLKNRVVDSCYSGELDSADSGECQVPKLGASSSSRKPFLTRHFSLGAKWGRSMSENASTTTTKKGFWSRYHKN